MKPADQDTDFMRKVSAKADRKLKAQRQSERNVWQGLGMLGMVGWSVAVPTLLGLGLGVWLDQCCTGAYAWTLNLLLLGMVLGCLNAWRWVTKEDKAMHADKENKDD